MKSNLKKILLTSTVFTCLNASFNLVFADAQLPNIETPATNDYLAHHKTHFTDKIDNNPLMSEIQAQQQAHRDTLRTDVELMLNVLGTTITLPTPQPAADVDNAGSNTGTSNFTDQDGVDVSGGAEEEEAAPFTIDDTALLRLKNIITAALTADADAINDVEDKHDAKTASNDVDTAETLLRKATEYQTAKDANNIADEIQHYRLAYFLMTKLKLWIEKNYNKDRVEVETILKDQIPTHYPEWLVDVVAEKIETLTLQPGTVVNNNSATVNFPIEIDADSLGKAGVYKYGDNQNPLSVCIQAAGKSATITGLTQYGVYYVAVGGKKYYFTVDNTAANEFIYAPDRIVKIDSQPNDALGKLAANDASFKPILSFSGSNDVTVSLDGSNWQKLSEIDANAFIKSKQTVQFKGLGVGEYTFEVASPYPQRFSTAKTSFRILPQIIKPTATAESRDYVENDKTAKIISFGPTDKVKVNHTANNGNTVYGSFDNASPAPDKLVTVHFGFDNNLTSTKQNYLLIPTAYTTANINGVTTGAGAGGSSEGSNLSTLTGEGFTVGLNSYEMDELRAIGKVTNIPPDSYSVTVNGHQKTMVVNQDNTFYVPLASLSFTSGESVTVQMTDGTYNKVATFTMITVALSSTIAATSGSGTGTLTFGNAGFNGKFVYFTVAEPSSGVILNAQSAVSGEAATVNVTVTPNVNGSTSVTTSVNVAGVKFTGVTTTVTVPFDALNIGRDGANLVFNTNGVPSTDSVSIDNGILTTATQLDSNGAVGVSIFDLLDVLTVGSNTLTLTNTTASNTTDTLDLEVVGVSQVGTDLTITTTITYEVIVDIINETGTLIETIATGQLIKTIIGTSETVTLTESYANGTYYIVIKDSNQNVVGIGKFTVGGGPSTGMDPDTPPQ